MRFLGSHSLPERPRVLLVQTANPDLTRHVLNDLIRRFPEGTITLFRQRNMESHLPSPTGIPTIDNVNEGKFSLALRLRSQAYDLVCMIQSKEPGYWKLKLLPFLCNPLKILIYDRYAESRDFTGRSLLQHGPSFQTPWRLSLARKALAPFLLLYVALGYWIFGKEKISRSQRPGSGR